MTGDRRGFTLMELLVVLGIFSLVVTMASAIFLQTNRAQRRVLTATAAQADLRYVLEAIVREVRTGAVDYTDYAAGGGVPVPTDHLILKNAAGQREDFYLERDPAICPAGSAQCVAMKLNGGAGQSLTSIGVNVQSLSFLINPQVDPFSVDPASGLYPSNVQPTVTMTMRVKTVGASAQDPIVSTAQTTATSRSYVR